MKNKKNERISIKIIDRKIKVRKKNERKKNEKENLMKAS